MRKLVCMLVMLSGVWFTSCNKDSSTLSPTEESAISTADLESLVSGTAARNAVLSDSTTKGKCKGRLTEVAVADLSTTITDYITATYPGSTIKYAAKDESGKVIVAITLADGTVAGLLFNADGTFMEELKPHLKKAKLTKVEISAIPEAITTYIAANYAGSEIKNAGTNSAGEYYIAIIIDSKIKVLLFNADGSFNKELEQPLKGRKKH